ncbi:serine/threonine-protein kinase [Kitasatospora sp. NPDC059803]|uniref:serine/threonine-protein kinase n=1 Tax=Kitasatospora sp. NPDC059803 TaxID=3346953 RepID=UPI00365C7F34
MRGPGAVLGGRYTLVERIGGGGMGTVWRADDTVLARPVAVKILHSALFEDDTFIQRFRREAQLVAAIDHPAVVDVHDYGESGGGAEGSEGGGAGDRCAYIVMELVDGRPLDRVLAEEGPMPPERALGLVAAALDGLHAAHRREIVHRDLKPSNLMVRTDGRVTITDFGIARAIASTKITASHAIVGTALYMAPEQAEGTGTGPASDLYSIGVVCFELLTGKPPFVGESVLEVALKHVRQPAPELPGAFPAAVRELVAKALEKKPEDRFADAAEMAAAARAAIGAKDAGAAAGAVGAPADTGTVDLRAAAAGGAAAGEEAGDGAPGGAGGAKAGAVVPVADGADQPASGERPASGDGPVPDEVAKVGPQPVTEPGKRRSRRALLVPVIVPVVISMGTATVLLVDRGPGRSDAAEPPAAQPTVVVTAPVTPGTGTPAAPATTPPATPTPSDTPVAAPAADQQPSTQNQPGAPVQAPAPGGNGGAASRGTGAGAAGGGNAAGGGGASGGSVGGSAGGASGGSASGASGGQSNQSGGGGGGGGGAANQPANPNPNPQPPAQNAAGGSPAGGGSPSGGNPPAPQTPTRPPSCGGTSWTTIVNVKDGRPIGMARDELSGDNPIVVGGASQYGWVRATNPGSWISFNACNSGGPLLVQTMDGKVTLSGGFSFLTNWTVRSGSAQGSYTLADYQNHSCMTDNGPGNAVTMVTCTPGNTAQEWRFQ